MSFPAHLWELARGNLCGHLWVHLEEIGAFRKNAPAKIPKIYLLLLRQKKAGKLRNGKEARLCSAELLLSFVAPTK